MKRVLAILAQFLLLLFVDAIGSLFYHPFRLETSISTTPAAPRSFIWDGVILMALVYAILLISAALRKRIAASAPGMTLALGLAGLVGYLLKFGFITHNW